MLRFIVPKHVEFKNRRLKLMYNILQISTFFGLFARFFGTGQYLKTVHINPYMAAELWVVPGSPERLAEVWAAHAATETCTSPESFDFEWDSDFIYTGHECLPPCGDGAAARCVHAAEAVRREAQDQVFFVTQFQDRVTGSDGQLDHSMHFVPLEEAHSVGLRYAFSVPMPAWLGDSHLPGWSRSETVANAGSDVEGDGGEGILTVLLSADGDPARVIEPSPSITIPMVELLAIAGETGALDRTNPSAGPNRMQDATHPEGGLGRITGIHIDLNIDCYRSQQASLEGREQWAGPVCYASARRSQTRAWATLEQTEPVRAGGDLHERTSHGMRVRTVLSGRMTFFNANTAFLQVMASLVFLALPKQIMFRFVIYALGHLSTIYRGVIIELFDVQMECARLTTRLLSTSVAFFELEDVDKSRGQLGTECGCISKLRVEEQLREVLKFRKSTLDEAEVTGLVRFCHDAVLKSSKLAKRPKLKDEILLCIANFCGPCSRRRKSSITSSNSDAQMGLRAQRTGLNCTEITIDDFAMCCAANEKLEFESFVSLFDDGRGVGMLEHVFLPKKLRPVELVRRHEFEADGQDARSLKMLKSQGSMYNLRTRHRQKMEVLHGARKSMGLAGSAAQIGNPASPPTTVASVLGHRTATEALPDEGSSPRPLGTDGTPFLDDSSSGQARSVAASVDDGTPSLDDARECRPVAPESPGRPTTRRSASPRTLNDVPGQVS